MFVGHHLLHEDISEDFNAKIKCGHLSTLSTESPAKLRISFSSTHPGDQKVVFGAIPPFSSLIGSQTATGAKLLLVPDSNREKLMPEQSGVSRSELVPNKLINGCWRAPSTFRVQAIANLLTLKKGQTVSQMYTLLDHPTNEICFPDGKYGFEDKYEVDDSVFTWGFEIEVDTF